MEKYDQAEPDEDANVSEENLAKLQKEFLTAIKEEPAAFQTSRVKKRLHGPFQERERHRNGIKFV